MKTALSSFWVFPPWQNQQKPKMGKNGKSTSINRRNHSNMVEHSGKNVWTNFAILAFNLKLIFDMNEIIIYQTKDKNTQIDVQFDKDTVWLNRRQLAVLFDRDVKTIGKHIVNVFSEGELEEKSVVAKFATTASDNKTYHVKHYNLGVIISVGHRVKSRQGTRFRNASKNT